MENKTSTVKLLSIEEITKELNKKALKSKLTNEYNPKEIDTEMVLSQYGAKLLFDYIEKNKIDLKKISDDYNPKEVIEKTVVSQKAINDLYKYLIENFVNKENVLDDFDLKNPSEDAPFSQYGANKLYKRLTDETIGFDELTSLYKNIKEHPSQKLALSQEGAINLYNEVLLKENQSKEFKNDNDVEIMTKEQLANKILSLEGAREFYRNMVANYVNRYGSEILGDLLFPVNTLKNEVGIKFQVDEDNSFKIASNKIDEKDLLSFMFNKERIISIYKDFIEFNKPINTSENLGIKTKAEAKYDLTLSDKFGVNVEGEKLVFYVNDKSIASFDSDGMDILNSRVATEDNPINAVSVDVEMSGHNFHNKLVCFFDGVWKVADLGKEHTADGFAVSITKDKFRVYFNGVIDINSDVKDEDGERIRIGEYYFVSQKLNGYLCRERNQEGVEQLAMKTMLVNGKIKGQLLLTEETNYNLFSHFALDDKGSVVGVEAVNGLIENVAKLVEADLKNKERLSELESTISDYERLYKNNFIKEHLLNHQFLLDAVYHNGIVWELSDLKDNKIADAIALKVDKDNFIIITKGNFEIPDSARDDNGREFVPGEYYYISDKKKGGFSKDKNPNYGIDQLGFKVITSGGKLKGMALINEEVNLDY